jgi:hypothetical protein
MRKLRARAVALAVPAGRLVRTAPGGTAVPGWRAAVIAWRRGDWKYAIIWAKADDLRKNDSKPERGPRPARFA